MLSARYWGVCQWGNGRVCRSDSEERGKEGFFSDLQFLAKVHGFDTTRTHRRSDGGRGAGFASWHDEFPLISGGRWGGEHETYDHLRDGFGACFGHCGWEERGGVTVRRRVFEQSRNSSFKGEESEELGCKGWKLPF